MKKKRIFIFLLLVSISIIFYFSHQGPKKSREISLAVSQVVEGVLKTGDIESVNFLIRKAGHFISYMTLAGFIFMGFTFTKLNVNESMLASFILVIVFAGLDEYHQTLVGRSGEVRDVVLDGIGGLFGLLLARSLFKNKFKR